MKSQQKTVLPKINESNVTVQTKVKSPEPMIASSVSTLKHNKSGFVK